MSDATAAKQADNDLRILVTGTGHKVILKDRFGKEHTLLPLDMADMCEYEAKLGQSLLTANLSALHVKDILFMLFLSLRKEGLSVEDIDRGAFKITERDVQRMFDLSMITKIAEVFIDLLRVSGYDVKEEETNPPKAS